MKSVNKKAYTALHQLNCSITNTLELLLNEGLLSFYNPLKEQVNVNEYGITWPNHKSSRLNTEKHYGKISQYKFFLKHNSITALMSDGSILKVAYFLNRHGILKSHSLLYWPCPFPIDDSELLPPLESLEYYENDEMWIESLRMRTPIRFDFDSDKAKEGHPASHLHMQSSDCRLHVRKPVCFNQFIIYIFQSIYPELYYEHTFWNGLENTLENIKIANWDDIINKNDVTIFWNPKREIFSN